MRYIDQIKQKRIFDLKLTQDEVDKAAGLSKKTMCKFESGKIRNTRIVEKIAKFFGGEIIIDFTGGNDEY